MESKLRYPNLLLGEQKDKSRHLLNRELSSLKSTGLSASVSYTHMVTLIADVVAYRKHTEQRCLARILQSDHGYVHLRRPVAPCQPKQMTTIINNTVPWEPAAFHRWTTYQKVLSSQSYTFRNSPAMVAWSGLQSAPVGVSKDLRSEE